MLFIQLIVTAIFAYFYFITVFTIGSFCKGVFTKIPSSWKQKLKCCK